MRYPEGHKEEVRGIIVQAAASALRREGLQGISIPALMKKAGLTHGGFYAHFKSRDELVAEAVLAAAEETGSSVLSNPRGLSAVLGTYLSKEHVGNAAAGCVLAALGSEGRRQPTIVRRAFAKAAQGFIRLLEQKRQPQASTAVPSDETLALASSMIGAIVLARLVDDEGLAERILKAVRRN